MCCPTEKPLHILMALPLAFRQAFFSPCSDFYMFKQARVLPALLCLGDQVKFSISGKNVDILPWHAHRLTLHQFPHWEVRLWHIPLQYIATVSLASCILSEFYPHRFPMHLSHLVFLLFNQYLPHIHHFFTTLATEWIRCRWLAFNHI